MLKQQNSFKSEPIRWTNFSRRSDAIFMSLGREITIGVLSVATLLHAIPANASGDLAVKGEPESENAPTAIETISDSVLLSGVDVVSTRAAIPADKAVRLVQVVTRKDIEASAAQSVNDLLKLVAGVDVRQRGPFGVQTDIGINGGDADQLTVLLNGVNISNPHTGHLTMDLPTSVDDIERIEVIEGGSSRVYGSQAFSGTINIVTRRSQDTNIGANISGGSYGTWGGNAHLNLQTGNVVNYISTGYSQSDGASENSDFKKTQAFLNGRWETSHFDLKWQGGLSRMDYGANTFYGTGSTSQYEEGRRYLLSLQGEYKGKVHILPQVYWNRSLDHYVWRRENPAAYQNFHQTNVYGANLNSYIKWILGTTSLGFEFRRENILSTRLGKDITDGKTYSIPGHSDLNYKYKDGRSNYSIYLEHNVILSKVSISLGVLANKNTAITGGMRFYPGVDVSYSPMEGMRVYASFNQSLRTPTYTDLYYNGPGLKGDSLLKPEKSTDFSLGVSYSNHFLSTQLKGYYRRGTDMIDWAKFIGDNTYRSANSDMDFAGVEAVVSSDFTRILGTHSWIQNATVSYCYNYKNRRNKEQAALYATDVVNLRHKLVASLNHRIFSRMSAQWSFQLKNRTGEFDNALTGQSQAYGTYATLDAKLMWDEPYYQLYLSANNITNHKYYDIANVQQPGIWFMSGIRIKVKL